MPGQVIKGEHDTRFEPVLNRYRRAPGDLDEKKLACTLYMRVSCASMLFCIIKESYQALETVFYCLLKHKFVKNTRLRFLFSTLFSVCGKCLSCLHDRLLVTLKNKIFENGLV